MPKLETLHPLALVETAAHLHDVLAQLPLTKNQAANIARHLSVRLPAEIQFEQRTPKSVVTITIAKDGIRWRVRVNNRAHISLPEML